MRRMCSPLVWLLLSHWLLIQSICDALTCLSCNSILVPVECTTVERCSPGQVCFGEKHQTSSGDISYRLGCRHTQDCPSDGALTLGKRATSRGISGDTISEETCCASDLCNDIVGNTPGYFSPRGPICYKCPSHTSPDNCDTITVCQVHEMCALYSDINYNNVFLSTCQTASLCSTMSNLFGKKRSFLDCFQCCDSDVCNDFCHNASTSRACASSPCKVGMCQETKAGYQCMCHKGYTGTNCDILQDDCYASPCHHGNCHFNGTDYVCTCDAGYTGKDCDIMVQQVDHCLSDPCLHGNCTSLHDTFNCICEPGYNGTNCDKVDPCDPDPCVRGTCSLYSGNYLCHCDIGYTGRNCDTYSLQDPCLSNPCVAGSCKNMDTGYVCTCLHGYTGLNCDTYELIDSCSPNPCAHGNCTKHGTGYACGCDIGYTGQHCEHYYFPDPCLGSPCLNGVCSHNGPDIRCTCNQGYDGVFCDHKLPPCVDSTPHATCKLAASVVCGSRDRATNANCLHSCGFC